MARLSNIEPLSKLSRQASKKCEGRVKKQVYWDDVNIGQEIPGYSLKIDATRIVAQVDGSQDYYPIHHDVEYARVSGLPDIVMSTGFVQGCFNRLICGWIGDEGWLHKFRMEMRRMNIPGDTMHFKGKVTKKYIADGEHCVELDLWCENEREGVTTLCQATAFLPSRNQ